MNYNIKEISYPLATGEVVTLNNEAIASITQNNELITNGEVLLFVSLCKYQKLNPLIGEAYLIKYDKTKPAQNVVSYSAYMRVADAHSAYDGIESGIIVQDKNGNIEDRIGCIKYPNETLLGGWAKVHRKDRKFPSVSRVDIKEYNKGKSMWATAPSLMINKVAKAQSLRQAFPQAFTGMYIEEEVGVETPTTPSPNPVPQKTYDITDTVSNIEPPPTDYDGFIADEEIIKPQQVAQPQEEIEETEPDLDTVRDSLSVGEVGRIKYAQYKEDRARLQGDRLYIALKIGEDSSYRESDHSILVKRVK